MSYREPSNISIAQKGVIDTAEYTPKALQAARDAAGLYQYQAAALIHVSEDTLSRWERGEAIPAPDQVDALEKLYKAPGLWYSFMRYTHKSFRDRYPEDSGGMALAMSMVHAGYQMADVARRQDDVIRDAIDGHIDNQKDFAAYLADAKKLYAALGAMLAQAEMKGG